MVWGVLPSAFSAAVGHQPGQGSCCGKGSSDCFLRGAMGDGCGRDHQFALHLLMGHC